MVDLDELYAGVGRRVRDHREKLGLTQKALATLVSLTRTSITNIERGSQKLLLHTLVELAHALHVSPASLLGDQDAVSAENELSELLKDRPRTEQKWIKAIMESKKRGR